MELANWICTGVTLGATVAAIYKKWWCFLIWGVTNVYWMVYDYNHGAIEQMVVFAGYTVINVFGAKKWWNDLKSTEEK